LCTHAVAFKFLSGLIKFKFGFENHLKIYFEKLEKEKEKENHFLSVFSPELVSACLAAARFLLPRPLPHGPSPAAAAGPVSRERLPLSFASLTAWAHASVASPSPSCRHEAFLPPPTESAAKSPSFLS
jgi:hypothetical protein